MVVILWVFGDNGWEVFVELVGGMFVWVCIGDYLFVELQVVVICLDVLLLLGSGFSLEGEESDWLCINIVYVSDLWVLVFFEVFG